MSSIIKIEGYNLKVEDGDNIEVEKHECGKCESYHTKLTVERKGEEVCVLGDERWLEGDKPEVFGGVLVDDNGIPWAEPKFEIHIIPNSAAGMYDGHYRGMCGKVLRNENNSPYNHYTGITFMSDLKFLKYPERVCEECKEIAGVK